MVRHRIFWPGAWFLPVLLTLFGIAATQLPGCAGNPVGAARDLEQRAYAVYGSFVIVEEQGAKVVMDPAVPQPVKAAIQTADAKAKPSADALLNALQQYTTASAEVKAGTSSADKLSIATANLQTWIGEASADVTAFSSAIKAAPRH